MFLIWGESQKRSEKVNWFITFKLITNWLLNNEKELK